MKKLIILFFALTGLVPSVNAQLKVDSLGHVAIGNIMPSSLASLTFNDVATSSYLRNYCIHSDMAGKANFYNFGYFGKIRRTTPSYVGVSVRGIGVYGVVENTRDAQNYGVMGVLSNCNYGAGIYGSSTLTYGKTLSGLYAGYFDGDTYVDGTLTATSMYFPSDINLKENIVYLSDNRNGATALTNVLDMNVIQYNYKKREYVPDEMEAKLLEEDAAASGVDVLAAREAYAEAQSKRLHFGLIAQELQTIYPNLVEENEEGYLSVNYVELVPILIRSIQELKQEVDELRGIEETARKAKQSTPTAVTSATTTNTSTLYQNTPNPFKEQTVIRYRLADNTKNAAICIFDMQGKLLKKYPISSGSDSLSINGYEFGEGMFLYTLMVNGQEIDTKRMILTK